ncbi:MAG: flagellar basal body rod protein FlgC [Magnetospirillum sp.]|nr:flagellar basal body rod protein FlgC [Magnetospirillum sp.]
MDDLEKSTNVAISGLKAQAERLRVISENLANADSTAQTPDGQPYRRKVITFKNVFDRVNGINQVEVNRVQQDQSDPQRRYDPKNPAADREGYVLTPNINPMIEIMDMREAQRSYEANLNVVNTSRALLSQTVQLLR